jgi:hypothetical protein
MRPIHKVISGRQEKVRRKAAFDYSGEDSTSPEEGGDASSKMEDLEI